MNRRSVICFLLAIVCMCMSLTGCSDEPFSLEYDAASGRYIDEDHDVAYLRAPDYYEAVAIEKSEAYAVWGDESFYRIRNTDALQMIANEYFEVLYEQSMKMPALWEMQVNQIYVGLKVEGAVMDLTDTVIEDGKDISTLIGQYQKGDAVAFDRSKMLEGNRISKIYHLRFASAHYPSFYFRLNYYRYEQDVVIYEVIDSKDGFVPTYAGAISVEFDESYVEKYGELYAVYHFGTEILHDPITDQCFAIGDTISKHVTKN